jgi:hypothetical protein
MAELMPVTLAVTNGKLVNKFIVEKNSKHWIQY